MEESIEQGAGGHANYLLKLKDIYREIVTASAEGVCSASGCCNTHY